MSLLDLAQELQSLSTACRIMGYHRRTFCEVRRAFHVRGGAALFKQLRLLERHSVDFRCRHVEAARPGELLNQGTLTGVGRVYVQVVVDVFCSLAFAKGYTATMPVTACDLLYDRVLPFYDALGVCVGTILTDNGREYCGRADSHPCELLLPLEGIARRTIQVRSPRTKGFVERMNRPLLDECFRVAGRTTWSTDPAEIQRDLDVYLNATDRLAQWKREMAMYGIMAKTPRK